MYSVVHCTKERTMAKFELSLFILKWLGKKFENEGWVEFDWDEGNSLKNERKHGVLLDEIEEVFKDKDLFVLGKQFSPPTGEEERFGCIGFANDKILYVVFTLRNEKIRPIHARRVNQKEKNLYEEQK